MSRALTATTTVFPCLERVVLDLFSCLPPVSGKRASKTTEAVSGFSKTAESVKENVSKKVSPCNDYFCNRVARLENNLERTGRAPDDSFGKIVEHFTAFNALVH